MSTVAGELVRLLSVLGVDHAFGVSGGAIAYVWAALTESPIAVIHCRHEAGAAFAAMESYFASGRAAVVFTTTGPGFTNVLTGVVAARTEGAKLILVTPFTATGHRGRFAFQETSAHSLPITALFTAGPVFHYAAVIEDAAQLGAAAHALAAGLSRPDGFIAHLSIPTVVQKSAVAKTITIAPRPPSPPSRLAQSAVDRCAELLDEGPFAVWVGFGARFAAPLVRAFVEKSGAPVLCSPRAKGIVSENDPQFVGVTGFGGHDSALRYMQEHAPHRILVLGSRLGELTSYWSASMVPAHGFVHVDVDHDVPGAAFPDAETFAVESDVAAFLESMIPLIARRAPPPGLPSLERPVPGAARDDGLVRPTFLHEEIQRVFVDGSDALVMAESGTALAFANHMLRFEQPGRYRASTSFSSLGHAVTGVIGAALATRRKVVTVTGDGAMLMQCEINTAVKYRLPIVWIVQNDAGYNMCEQGMAALGLRAVDCRVPQADFTAVARGMGAAGIRVTGEAGVRAALEAARDAAEPFVVDVLTDPSEPAPYGRRLQSLQEGVAMGEDLENYAF